MPRYDYFCEKNQQTVEVTHPIATRLQTWGELCELAGIELRDVPAATPVRRIITTPPMANTPVGNSGLKNLGFTKLVKRDDGVYENVTRSGTEARYMKAGDALLFVDGICHGSAKRVNAGVRRIVVYRYGPSWGNFRHGYHPSPELLQRLTPEQRKIVWPQQLLSREPQVKV